MERGKKKDFSTWEQEQDSYVPKGSFGADSWVGMVQWGLIERENILRAIYKRLRSMKLKENFTNLLWPLSQFNVSLHACHTNLWHFFLFFEGGECEHYQRVYSPDSYATEKLLSANTIACRMLSIHFLFSPFNLPRSFSPRQMMRVAVKSTQLEVGH